MTRSNVILVPNPPLDSSACSVVGPDSLAGWSSADDDTFSINVMQFGSVFWIEAPEFDDIGYFDTLEEAKGSAEANYEPFITEASEHKD